jgi:hypothetical protein
MITEKKVRGKKAKCGLNAKSQDVHKMLPSAKKSIDGKKWAFAILKKRKQKVQKLFPLYT